MQSSSSFLILHEDDFALVIRKPSGWLVHPTPIARDRETCLTVLERELGKALFSVHRIDRGTSGVLLFAKTREVAQALSLDFERQKIEKTYLAVVRGWPETEGLVSKKLARETHLEAREAQTAFKVLKTCELPFAVSKKHTTSRYALVRVFPKTGRRHQIRRHFVSVRHPIIGDRIYGEGRHNRFFDEHYGVSRLLLFAEKMSFRHPITAETLTIQSPLCPELKQLFDRLGWTEY